MAGANRDLMRGVLAMFWSGAAVAFFGYIVTQHVPEANQRVVDNLIGFFEGTVVTLVLGFYFASSKSSVDKDEYIKSTRNNGSTESK